MPCKLVVSRYASGKLHKGDCLGVYPSDVYLGERVEPQGGVFVIIDIIDADPDDEELNDLCMDWLVVNDDGTVSENDTYNKRKYLEPVTEGQEYYGDLLLNGRISVKKTDVMNRVRVRS